MDEILIEDKKYISSKQAAKVTGYAKDYIGQLCREGRVPARLVGRSWYVLESAVHDHRFGNPKDEPAEAPKSTSTRQSTWESPRYEAFETATLPSINRLHEGEEPREIPHDEENDSEAAKRLQENWQAWFDRFDTVTAPTIEAPMSEIEAPTESISEVEEPETEVPIRAIHHQQYQPAPQELLPVHASKVEDIEYVQPPKEEEKDVPEEKRVRNGRRLPIVLQVVGFVIAMISASLAMLGSGYLDEYIVSNSQVGFVAGIEVYNK